MKTPEWLEAMTPDERAEWEAYQVRRLTEQADEAMFNQADGQAIEDLLDALGDGGGGRALVELAPDFTLSVRTAMGGRVEILSSRVARSQGEGMDVERLVGDMAEIMALMSIGPPWDRPEAWRRVHRVKGMEVFASLLNAIMAPALAKIERASSFRTKPGRSKPGRSG